MIYKLFVLVYVMYYLANQIKTIYYF